MGFFFVDGDVVTVVIVVVIVFFFFGIPLMVLLFDDFDFGRALSFFPKNDAAEVDFFLAMTVGKFLTALFLVLDFVLLDQLHNLFYCIPNPIISYCEENVHQSLLCGILKCDLQLFA